MNARLPAAMMVILLLGGASAPAAAMPGPFLVLVTFENRYYDPGEVVNFTVFTFARGKAAVPDDIPQVLIMTGPGSSRAIPVSTMAPGEWSGNYTVLAADAGDHGSISLQARAYFSGLGGGDDPYTSSFSVHLANPPLPQQTSNLSIRSFILECPDGAIRPQSGLKFQVCATYDGIPVSAADIRFWMVYRSDAGAEERTDVSAEERGPGTFVVPYTVPKKAQSGSFRLRADCHGETDLYLSYVSLDFFNVIYHELGRNGSAIDYELLVSDRSGNPVNGSSVVVWMTSYWWGIDTAALELGKTDQGGKVRGIADFGPSVGQFYIRGWANTSRYSQYFYGNVRVSDAPGPGYDQGSQFYIELLSPEGSLQGGVEAALSYRAYYEREPLRRQELDCYVRLYRGTSYSSSPLGTFGRRVVTDDDGIFTVNVTFPAGVASFAIVTAVGPGPRCSSSYNSDQDPVTVSAPESAKPEGSVKATFSVARAGQPVSICASAPADVPVSARAYWDFQYNGSSTDRPWMVLSTFIWYFSGRPSGQSLLRGQLVLPRHVKAGQNLSVTITLTNSSGQSVTGAFTLKVRPAAASEEPVDTCCITGLFVINILLIVLWIYFYIVGRRGGAHRDYGETEAEERIDAVLRASRMPRDLSLPIKVELVRSEECTACGRKIAQGNLAWRCVCGARYHEHCTGDGTKCPSCGRGWAKS